MIQYDFLCALSDPTMLLLLTISIKKIICNLAPIIPNGVISVLKDKEISKSCHVWIIRYYLVYAI